jgi:adenylyltransferase/sulfurtransferase
MSITIEIPTPLRRFAEEQSAVAVEGATVGEALADLTRRHPELARHLFDDAGALRSFVNVFLGDENVRHLDGTDTALGDGATLMIIPSIAGGGRP